MPALVDFTRAAKGLCRSHIVYAHVWALVVIEVYGFGNGCHHLADIREPHVLEQLILHRVVDPFGLRIVLGITVLGHADRDMITLQYFHIFPAGILQAPVGVVYQFYIFQRDAF